MYVLVHVCINLQCIYICVCMYIYIYIPCEFGYKKKSGNPKFFSNRKPVPRIWSVLSLSTCIATDPLALFGFSGFKVATYNGTYIHIYVCVFVCICMYVWGTDEWMNGWLDGWMVGCLVGWLQKEMKCIGPIVPFVKGKTINLRELSCTF